MKTFNFVFDPQFLIIRMLAFIERFIFVSSKVCGVFYFYLGLLYFTLFRITLGYSNDAFDCLQ